MFLFKSKYIWNNLHPVSFQLWTNRNYQKHLYFKKYEILISLEELEFPYQWLKPEDDTNLQYIRHKLSSAVHPIMVRKRKCTLLLLNNLAYPEWNSISCTDAILNHVVCFIRHEEIKIKSSYSTNLRNFCPKNSILSNEMCYTFLWYDGKYSKFKILKHCFNSATSHKSIISVFQGLFYAIQLDTFTFLLPNDKSNTILSYTFQRIWMRTFTKKKLQEIKNSKGYLTYSESRLNHSEHSDDTIFLCRNTAWISYQYVCDGVDDCTDGNMLNISSDENDCKYYEEFFHLKRQLKRTGFCPPLQYKSRSGECLGFIATYLVSLHSDHYMKNATFLCDNRSSTIVHSSLVNDLVVDCFTTSNDEKEYIRHLTEDSFTACRLPKELPCVFGTSVCYNISDICIYKLTQLGNLIPCRTGSHLADCKYFECNTNYKCPDYYCIPFGYICDGKWDCPMGEDETNENCTNIRICKYMLKCRNSLKCIHLSDMCDTTVDCPYADDEKLCSVRNICPISCSCFLFALSCTNTSVHYSVLASLPYISINFRNVFILSMHLLGLNKKVQILHLSNNSLTGVCFHVNNLFSLKYIDVSKNRLQLIEKFCFRNLFQLSLVLLHTNGIWFLESRAFANLTTILLLDMSNNNITYISKYLFDNVTRLYVLILYKNPMTHLMINMFSNVLIDIILTNEYRICCVTHFTVVNVECSASPPWFTSCSRLFSNSLMRISFCLISIIIIVLNTMSLIQKIVKSMQTTIGSTFNITVGL